KAGCWWRPSASSLACQLAAISTLAGGFYGESDPPHLLAHRKKVGWKVTVLANLLWLFWISRFHGELPLFSGRPELWLICMLISNFLVRFLVVLVCLLIDMFDFSLMLVSPQCIRR
ncbi:unnamed protein product, partial [Musa textilis]